MLKTVIEDFIKHNNSIAQFLKKTSDSYQDGTAVISVFVEKLNETSFNSELGNSFAELLQLSDDEKELDQFELSDISKLYESLLKLQETNIETFINAGYFEFSVMDNPIKAKDIATAGINLARRQMEQLQRLLDEING